MPVRRASLNVQRRARDSGGGGVVWRRTPKGANKLRGAPPSVGGLDWKDAVRTPACLIDASSLGVHTLAHHRWCHGRTQAGWNRLHYAARDGSEAQIRRLLAAGFACNAPAKSRETPLHVASESGNTPAVAALLAAGARVDAADVRGWTPVHAAAYAGHSGALRLLLEEARESKRAVQSTHAFTLDVRFTCCDVNVAATLTSPSMRSHGRVVAMSTGAPNSAAPCCQGRTPRRRGSVARLWREHCRPGRRWHDCRGPSCRLGVEPRAGVESLCSAPSAR